MIIGLNLLHVLPEAGGVWNYIQYLLHALGQYDHHNKYIAFTNRKSTELVPQTTSFLVKEVGIRPTSRIQRIAYENTILLYQARKCKVDCVHWFANTQSLLGFIPGVVTMYDLHAFRQNAPFHLLKLIYLRAMISRTIRKAALLLPMSEATAADMSLQFGVDRQRMVVVPAIVNSHFYKADKGSELEFIRSHQLPEKYWLYVAHFYKHKNHVRLLHAYAGLKGCGFKPWPLVFRGDRQGAEATVMKTIKALDLKDDVIFMPRLELQDMHLLYSAASAVIYPSLYEGCGMPVLEAMACGCPVVVSDIPSMRENASDAALFFDPADEEDIGKAIQMMQVDGAMRQEMVQNGLRKAGEHRPELVVSKVLEAYRRVVKNVDSNSGDC